QINAVVIAAVTSFAFRIERLEIGRTRTNAAVSDFDNGSVRFPSAPPAIMPTNSGAASMMPSCLQPSSTLVGSSAGTKMQQGIVQAMKIGTITWARHSYQIWARFIDRNGCVAAGRQRANHWTKRLQVRQS